MLFDHLKPRTSALLRAALIISIAAVAAVSLAYTFLAPGTADDFCRGSWPTEPFAWLKKVEQNYLTFTGRWAAHTVYGLTFPYIDLTHLPYNLLLLTSPLLWFTSICAFLHAMFRERMAWTHKAPLAVLLTAILWDGMPGPGETWYWLTGSVEYQLPFMLMSIAILVASSSWVTGRRLAPKVAGTFLVCLLGVVVSGLNEMVGMLLAAGLAIGVALSLMRGRPGVTIALAVAALATVVGIAITVSAPGTKIRVSQDFPNAYSLSSAVLQTFFDPTSSPLAWLGDARLLCLGLLVLTFPWPARLVPEWATWKLPLPGWLSSMAVVTPLLGFGLVLFGMFAVSYAQGNSPPDRVVDTLYALFVIVWFASLVPLAAKIDLRQAPPIIRGANIAAAVLLPITLLASPTMVQGARQLPNVVRSWRPAYDARDRDLRAQLAAGKADVTVTPIAFAPKMFFWADLNADPADWHNVCVAKKYRARTVRRADPVVGS